MELPIELAGLYMYAYLVGSVPSAYLVGKLTQGVDIRSYGSGNVGVTNLVRQTRRAWLIPLGVFDVLLKGSSPILVAHYLLGLDRVSSEVLVAPILSLIGHNWSVFIGFQGGRGIAAVSGTLLALSPVLIGAVLAVFAMGWLVTRSAGVWVLLSLMILPIWAILVDQPTSVVWLCVAMLTLILLKRLLSNGSPMPQDVPRRKVLFNRAFRDRDIDDRLEWIDRVPATDKLPG